LSFYLPEPISKQAANLTETIPRNDVDVNNDYDHSLSPAKLNVHLSNTRQANNDECGF
jgi:hypothetical protein